MANINEIFQGIDTALKENPSKTKGLDAIYQFDLDGAGTYHLVLKGDDSYAKEGSVENFDCSLTMPSEDFEKMVDGSLNGTQAFMRGRCKSKGNMGLA